MEETPALYWWQYGQIVALYVGITSLICAFMRRYLYDPEEFDGPNKAKEVDNEFTKPNPTV